jgi:hypothetical protein
VGQLHEPPHVQRRADRVRRGREGHDARAVGQLPLQVADVEREIVVHTRDLHHDPEVVRELEPRGHVGVVVERRDDDLVALSKAAVAGKRPREREVEVGHGRAEDRLFGRAAEERGGAFASRRDQRVRALRGLVRGADVCVRLAHVGGDRVDHLVRALRAAGAVEERERPLQRRVARTDRLDIQQGGAHRISSPSTVQR